MTAPRYWDWASEYLSYLAVDDPTKQAILARLAAGAAEYGDSSYELSPAEQIGEVKQELEDVIGWLTIALAAHVPPGSRYQSVSLSVAGRIGRAALKIRPDLELLEKILTTGSVETDDLVPPERWFAVPIDPRGSPRAETSRYGGRHHKEWYSHYKDAIASAYLQQYGSDRLITTDKKAGLSVSVVAIMPRAASHWRKNGTLSATAPMLPTSKPDNDNIEKGVWDALNGIAWPDDAQICHNETTKRYVEDREEQARLVVRISVMPRVRYGLPD